MNQGGVLVIGGATCSGKTALALGLAERFEAEIVGADSRQVYRGMPIGTAAPSDEERARIRHHLVGFLDPRERYSAARFASDALEALADIRARGKHAIVVGGTGFYLRALCGDVELSAAYDPELRARLAQEARLHPPAVLHAWLAARNPERAAAIAPTDPYRIVRALEITLAQPRGEALPRRSLRDAGVPFVKIALQIEQKTLDARIAARTDAMLAGGFVDEAERTGADAVAADAVGYPLALAYLAGQATYEELRLLIVRATRRYAKRQRTWFKREPNVRHISGPRALAAVADEAQQSLGWG